MNGKTAPVSDHALKLFLRRLTTHSSLSGDEEAAILSLGGSIRAVGPNTDFVEPGQSKDVACLVASGLVARFSPLIDGRRQITALYIPGDMGDLHSLVRPRVDWALQALSASTIFEVRHRDLRRITARHPGLLEVFWRDCEIDSARLTRWIVNFGRREASTRLANLLCEMATRNEVAGVGSVNHFALPMTQTQLGDTLGLTAVHVNRMLQKLRSADLVHHKQGAVHIPDWERLATWAEYQPEHVL